MALTTTDSIWHIVEADEATILASTDDTAELARDYAEQETPIYYGDIIAEWMELPDDMSNQYHDYAQAVPARIEDLMQIDLQLYYEAKFAEAIDELRNDNTNAPETA